MKYVLASLLLIPGIAFATGGAIRCTTEGTLGPVVVTITAEDSMLGWPVRAKVVAQGRRHIEVEIRTTLVSHDALGNIKIALNEVEPTTGRIVEGGAQAELRVTGELIKPGITAIGQTGELEILNHGSLNRILGTQFELANCRGVL